MAFSTPLLDRIDHPIDLRKLSVKELPALADELRKEVIDVVSKTGGHLGASLGVIELTIALHYVFQTPEDRLIWDVSHQSYPHKILTGRRKQMATLRQGGGLSGFTSRKESVFDPFGAAHSSTSISAGLGFATARDLQGKKHHVISVIGDGAMSAGMAYEAMNNAGVQRSRLLVILNDNDMSIAPPVGAMSHYLSRLLSSRSYLSVRSIGKLMAQKFPSSIETAARRAEEFARGILSGGTLFEELGFLYIGPVNGHELKHLLPILQNLSKSTDTGPVLLHCVTQKGKGYKPAESARDKYHGVGTFDPESGSPKLHALPKKGAKNCTEIFAQTLVEKAKTDPAIVAVTAAMPAGTGLDLFAKHFPERSFDVGIAEQHAVTFCAGLACEGFKPFAAIYSTFLQRAYDQVVHDVAIQSLPVRFAIDRAGLVGADGVTHQGSYDLAFLACLPNFVLMAPGHSAELAPMVETALEIDDRPSAFRYPRGALPILDSSEPVVLGKGCIVEEGHDVAFLSYGATLASCLKARDILEEEGVSVSVVNARFAKPLDEALLLQLARHHQALITVEEGAMGGFSALVARCFAQNGVFDKGLVFRTKTLPDCWLDHDTPEKQREQAGLCVESLVQAALSALGKKVVAKTLGSKAAGKKASAP